MYQTYETLIQGLLDKGFGSVDNWFSEDELIGLRKSLLAQYDKDNFHVAGIGNKHHLQKEKTIRNDQVYWLNKASVNVSEVAFFQKINEFVDYLNRTCFAGIQEHEFHYAVYEEGSFYKRHVDRFKNDTRRQFSFVSYLTEDWQDGDGGELVIYNHDESKIIVQPTPGRVVFFTSDLPHEVLVSKTQRLSLTGWMKTAI